MSLNRYAKRRDANETPIIAALLQAGVDVIQLDEIDIIAGHAGKNYLLEVKNPERVKKLTKRQQRLREQWRGQYAIVVTPEEALRVLGL